MNFRWFISFTLLSSESDFNGFGNLLFSNKIDLTYMYMIVFKNLWAYVILHFLCYSEFFTVLKSFYY